MNLKNRNLLLTYTLPESKEDLKLDSEDQDIYLGNYSIPEFPFIQYFKKQFLRIFRKIPQFVPIGTKTGLYGLGNFETGSRGGAC
jgi:hypothetical protein